MTRREQAEKQSFYLMNYHLKQQEMTGNICKLLETGKSEEIRLAFQLMNTGGVPEDLLSYILVLKIWHPTKWIRKQAQALFNKFAPKELKIAFEKVWQKDFKFEKNESKIETYLLQLKEIAHFNINAFANYKLKITKKGAKFCLENQTASYDYILSCLIENNSLYLENFELSFLPSEIGNFPFLLTLNISGNHFDSIPDEIQNLTLLEELYFNRTPLNTVNIQKLEKFFPHIFAQKYFDEGNDFKLERQYLKAIKKFSAAVQFLPDFAEAWQQLGASQKKINVDTESNQALEKALELYQLRINQNQLPAYNYYKIATIQALIEDVPSMILALQQSFQLNIRYRDKVHFEEEFSPFLNDEKMLILLNSSTF